jgi:tetratricopeptide (TPR) repeat protein
MQMFTRSVSPILFASVLAAAAVAQEQAPPMPVMSELEQTVAAVFRSPTFQVRFAESYLAETDIEPRVDEDEREILIEVSGMLATPVEQGGPRGDAAIALLEGQRGKTATAVFDFTLATIFAQREKWPEAIAAYEIAVDKAPKFRRAWNNLGLAWMRAGDSRGAARAFARVLELGGGSAYTYGLLGVAHGKNGDHLAAESAYRMATLLDPLTADWRMGLADSFVRQRRYAEAAALCATLIESNPERANLWLLQANAFIGMNEPKKAAENYEVVAKLGHATADSLNTLGDVYANDDLAELAAAAYLQAMNLDQKGNPQRSLRAAKALAARGAHAECGKLLDGIEKTYAGKLDTPAQKDVLKLRARLAVAAGAGEQEAKVLAQIVDLDPLDGEALLLLGQYYQRQGQPEQAVMQFERAAGIAAHEADAKVRHAQLLVGQGRYGEALPLLKRAQQVKPRENIQQFLDQVERAQNK